MARSIRFAVHQLDNASPQQKSKVLGDDLIVAGVGDSPSDFSTGHARLLVMGGYSLSR